LQLSLAAEALATVVAVVKEVVGANAVIDVVTLLCRQLLQQLLQLL
jgi:hypothetical protein